jgi:hypothetical protein
MGRMVAEIAAWDCPERKVLDRRDGVTCQVSDLTFVKFSRSINYRVFKLLDLVRLKNAVRKSPNPKDLL